MSVIIAVLQYFWYHTDPKAINRFGGGEGAIYSVRCFGHETSLLDCTQSGNEVHYCDHNEDAGVSCGNSSLL